MGDEEKGKDVVLFRASTGETRTRQGKIEALGSLSEVSPVERRRVIVDALYAVLNNPIDGMPDDAGLIDLLITREVMLVHETYIVPIVRDLLKKFSQSVRNKPDVVMVQAKRALEVATVDIAASAVVEVEPEIRAALVKQIRDQMDAIVEKAVKEGLAKALERIKAEMFKE